MADENEVVGGDDAVEFEATLVHGTVYYLRNKVFQRGVPQPVTNAEKVELESEEHAADVLSHIHGNEIDTTIRMKFSFAPVGSGRDKIAAGARAVESAEASPPRRVRQAGAGKRD